jgi:hypothetical protein
VKRHLDRDPLPALDRIATRDIMLFNASTRVNCLQREKCLFRACSVIFNPYGLEGIDTDWERF